MSEILYNTIGTSYNTTRHADSWIVEKMYQHLSPQQYGYYLDVGCGTGNYTIALAEKGLDMYGIDPSEKMLQVAIPRHEKIGWERGSAEKIRMPDRAFDGIMGMLTIHHWAGLGKSLKELSRVLAKMGKMVFFTSTPEQMEGYWLNHYFPQMMQKSALQMPSIEKIQAAAANAGLEIMQTEKYFVKPDLMDAFLYIGKHDPELYFGETLRSGISSFAALSNEDEVQAGLSRLRADIDSGSFPAVKERFENELGDYIFIVLQRKNDDKRRNLRRHSRNTKGLKFRAGK